MEITLKLEMTWKDDRLTFLNIMDENNANIESVKDVSASKQKQIWLPLDKIVHENAVIGEIKVGSNSFVRVVANTEALESNVNDPIEGSKISIEFNLNINHFRCAI